MVDRNPAVQELRIILAQPNATWEVIGGSKVSTGQSGRRGYFITPLGVFLHTDGILDYRALGTFNENHIRGLGLKGMRVWDFGWQTAERGWRVERDPAEIRLLMHATDPDYLEQRLGHPASEGIRAGACDDEPDSWISTAFLTSIMSGQRKTTPGLTVSCRATVPPRRWQAMLSSSWTRPEPKPAPLIPAT